MLEPRRGLVHVCANSNKLKNITLKTTASLRGFRCICIESQEYFGVFAILRTVVETLTLPLARDRCTRADKLEYLQSPSRSATTLTFHCFQRCPVGRIRQGSTLGGSRLFPYLSAPDELEDDPGCFGKLETSSMDLSVPRSPHSPSPSRKTSHCDARTSMRAPRCAHRQNQDPAGNPIRVKARMRRREEEE